LDAVQKVQELQPDLILLDIGLPKLNGIAVAREVKKISPRSNILFVSQEASADVVDEALNTGAEGYLCKMDAGGELLAAIEAVVQDKRYLSRSLTSGFSARQTRRSEFGANPGLTDSPRNHEVAFYCDDRSLLDGFTLFAATALNKGHAAIVLATEPHREAILAGLCASGIDVRGAIEQGRYVALDPSETLSAFMVDGLPDPILFRKAAVDLIVKTAESVDGDTSRVDACGECAPILWQKGNAEAAIHLERFWDEIGKLYGMQIFCGYLLASFQGGIGSFVFERICKEHSAVLSR
jgi:hypothetical protein